ncbi:uncharacterized protein LOC124842320 [Vigna umbellata]|uniref:uncharacterized protein LOC124842320 n=1 Tax=Vigna umbellata TaxID=87088 RepID=UPI001F5FA23F|nr:uncharacterized protein LOC124842320 [Vigna umbellata]
MDTPDPTTQPSSLFYLHLGENPGTTLISQILNETNYSSWSRNLKRALLSKNKIKFIDGSIKKTPRNDTLFDAWERCDTMVLSWIIKTLSPQITDSVIYVDNAKICGKKLKKYFLKETILRFQIYYRIYISLNRESEIVTLKYREVEHVICFRKGLNDTYQTVRTQILLMEPLPNINKVFSLLMQQEHKERPHPRVVPQTETFKILASTTNKATWKPQGRGTSSRGQGRGRGRNPNYGKQCSRCHKMNHTVDECYFKHGYLPWYKKIDNNNTQDMEGQNEWSFANVCNDDFTSTQTQNVQQGHNNNPM